MKRIAALLAGIMMMAAGSAYALPTLTLSDGTTTVTIEDGSALDTVGIAGIVGYAGTIGNWLLSTNTGFTPTVGPTMHLNSANTSTGAGELTIKFTDALSAEWFGTGATAAVGGYVASGGTVDFTTYINSQQQSYLGVFGGPGAFAESQTFQFTPTGQDIIELVAEIEHDAAGVTSFDFDVAPVPEPGTMLLLGAGFLGLAIYGKRRKNA